MFAAYREALLSYARQRSFQLSCLALAMCWAWLPPMPQHWLVLLESMLLGSMVAFHVCGRLSDFRARLLPDYRQAHLAALATICLVFLTALAVGTRVWLDASEITGVGPMILACAVGCWLVPAQSLGALLVAAIVLLGNLGLLKADWLGAVRLRPIGLGVDLLLGVAGIGLFGLFARWLWNLTEDRSPLFPRFVGAGWRGSKFGAETNVGRWPAPAESQDSGRWLTQWHFRKLDRRLERALRSGPAMRWRHVTRWLVPWSGNDMLPMALIVLALTAPTYWLLPPPNPNLPIPWMPAVMCGQIFLMLMFSILLLPRRPTLGIESLRPVTRAAFFKQQAAGVLAQWLVVVLLTFAMIAVGIYSRMDGLRIANWGLFSLAASFVATQFCMFAVFISLLRFEQEAAIGGSVLTMMLGFAGLVAMWAMNLTVWWQLGMTAAIAAGGAALFWDGYRRWLVTDLG